MSKFGFVEVPITQQIDGTALASSTTATSILAAASKFTLPANYFDAAGKAIRITAGGRVSTTSSSPGTLTLDVRLGSVVVFNGGASPTVATSQTNVTWLLQALITCRTIGASTSATLLGIGTLHSAALSTSTPIMLLPTTSPAAGTGFDSTAASVLDLFATWSVSNASNSIRCDVFQVELLN